MLITLELAKTFKIGNHNKDIDTTYISDLNVKSMNFKSGLASDTMEITIPKKALDTISPLLYLTSYYEAKVSLYIDNNLEVVLDGLITKVSHTVAQDISLSIGSKASYYMDQLFLPRIENVCQLQVYSKMCKLNVDDYKISLASVPVDAITGVIPYTLTDTTFTLGGVSIDISNLPLFQKKENYNLAFVRLNNTFRSRILSISDTNISIDLNYIDTQTNLDFEIILSCDKTFGMCYKRFNNTQNFFGFTNKGKVVKNYNIFTSEALVYCGESEESIIDCSTDDNLFGVQL